MDLAKLVRQVVIGRKTRKMQKVLARSQGLAERLGGPVQDYNLRMFSHRQRMHRKVDSFYERIKKNPNREEVLHLFLIYFSSIGAHMVQKADAWLTAWGHAMINLGFREIGEDYIHHAKEETGHDKWHRNDVRRLAEMYQARFGKTLDVERILNEGATAECVQQYYELSENTVAGVDAYLSLAELYETEIMALDLAPECIGYCVTELGFQILKGLSFLRGHVVSDIDHIQDNIKQLDAYLKKDDRNLSRLEEIGRQTIEIYIRYFEEALTLAERQQSTALK